MPVYVAIEITIHDPETFERYKALSPAALGAYGGKYLVRGATTTTLEGDWDPQRFVLLEFPDAASAKGWWGGPEYAEAKAIRQSAGATRMLLIEGPPFIPAREG